VPRPAQPCASHPPKRCPTLRARDAEFGIGAVAAFADESFRALFDLSRFAWPCEHHFTRQALAQASRHAPKRRFASHEPTEMSQDSDSLGFQRVSRDFLVELRGLELMAIGPAAALSIQMYAEWITPSAYPRHTYFFEPLAFLCQRLFGAECAGAPRG
jgi:hypothetical protein